MQLQIIDRNVYEQEVIKSGRPTLLCFFKNNFCQNEIVTSIKDLSREFSIIQFYAVQDDEHNYFFERFNFYGTPVFIFLENGVERGRLLGSISKDRLRAFIEGKHGIVKSEKEE